MKKKLLIIPATILIVAVVLASVVLSRCDQYVIGTGAEDSGTTVPSSETVTEAASPNWLELYKQYENVRGENKRNGTSNSVYYFIDSNKDVAIHKETQTIMENMCRDPLCTHNDEECVMGFRNGWSCIAVDTLDARIYFLCNGSNGERRLVSTDHSLNNIRIEWEREDGGIDYMQADQDRLYFLEDIYDEETGELLRTTVSWYDPLDQTTGFVKENMAIRSYIVHEAVLYAQIGLTQLVRCDVDNPMPETILEVESGKNISMVYVDSNDLVFSVITGFTFGEQQRLNLDTLQVTGYFDDFPKEYVYQFGQTFGDSSFVCIEHVGETYKDDPYYDFYTDSNITNVSKNRSLSAGRIYRVNEGGKLIEVAQLTTDGVPDLISSIRGYDGRYLYVWYGTYQSFQNELNPDSDNRKPQYTHLAMIDTQTGQVYKLTETSGE